MVRAVKPVHGWEDVNGLGAWLLYTMGRYTVEKFKKQLID